MDKLLFLPGLALVVVLAGAPAAWANDNECPGGLLTGEIDENVLVKSGTTCNIDGATVRGNVKVEKGGGLQISNDTEVFGNVQSDEALWMGIGFPFGASDQRVEIFGNVQIKKTTSVPPGAVGAFNFICDTDVRGDLQLEENGEQAPFDIGHGQSCHAERVRVGEDLQVYKNKALFRIGPPDSPAGTVLGKTCRPSRTPGD